MGSWRIGWLSTCNAGRPALSDKHANAPRMRRCPSAGFRANSGRPEALMGNIWAVRLSCQMTAGDTDNAVLTSAPSVRPCRTDGTPGKGKDQWARVDLTLGLHS